jgi:hypothetical protein
MKTTTAMLNDPRTQEAFDTAKKCVKLYGLICAIILGTVAANMPIAIIGVDLIPGVCPAWYAVMQAICALPLIAIAILTRGRQLRAAFPKS